MNILGEAIEAKRNQIKNFKEGKRNKPENTVEYRLNKSRKHYSEGEKMGVQLVIQCLFHTERRFRKEFTRFLLSDAYKRYSELDGNSFEKGVYHTLIKELEKRIIKSEYKSEEVKRDYKVVEVPFTCGGSVRETVEDSRKSFKNLLRIYRGAKVNNEDTTNEEFERATRHLK